MPIASLGKDMRDELLAPINESERAALIVPTTNGLALDTAMKNGNPIQFSINGTHGSAKDMGSVTQYPAHVSRNAVVFNELDFRLADITTDASNGIAAILDRAPAHTPIVLDGYSMGTRIATGVLINLNERGLLDRPVTVHLYGSTTPGYDAANLLPEHLPSPPFFNASNVDMGSNSTYQEYINAGALKLVNNNKIDLTIIDGSSDVTVPGTRSNQWAGGSDVVRNSVATKIVNIQGADHLDLLERASVLPKNYDTNVKAPLIER